MCTKISLRQGEYPQGEGVDTWSAFAFYICCFPVPVCSHPPPPLRSSPCLRGTVCWRGVAFTLYSWV